jgi:hypothetical protein
MKITDEMPSDFSIPKEDSGEITGEPLYILSYARRNREEAESLKRSKKIRLVQPLL